MLYRPFPIVIAFSLFCFAAITVRAEVLIDDFGDGGVTLHRELGESVIYNTQSGLSTDSVIGGSRDLSLRALAYDSGATGGVTVEVDPDAEVLNYTTDPGMTAVNFEISYGSRDEFLSADLTVGGADCLRFEFLSAAFGRFNGTGVFDIRVYTLGEDQEYRSGGADVIVPSSDTPFYVDLPFSELQRDPSHALDFSNTVAISIGSGNGNIPGNFVLDRIVAIPEPSTILLGCLGLMFLAGWRW